ncbi:hypothetical protein PR048_026478 [Dryococelus australis]|uniref:Uncharacterized protein n=1 Tax=Dryococelus australis TaxID=614101 RepID=A0ABQ9GLG9_9NEOP|nr:hypothetical protein PR048_026478 [Dryococelus australis]
MRANPRQKTHTNDKIFKQEAVPNAGSPPQTHGFGTQRVRCCMAWWLQEVKESDESEYHCMEEVAMELARAKFRTVVAKIKNEEVVFKIDAEAYVSAIG